MADDGKPRRVDVGFAGGQVMTVRLLEDEYRGLRSALEGDGDSRWHELTAEGAEVTLDLAQVVYVRLDTERRGVGFSGQ